MALLIDNCTYTGFAHVLDGCCCTYTCDIHNTFETCVVISSISDSTTGLPNNNMEVISVDGVPFTPPSGVPLPYTLPAMSSIEIEIKVCGLQPPTFTTDVLTIIYSECPDVSGIGSSITKTTRIHPDTVCDNITIDGNPYPATMDFGFVASGSSQDVFVDIEKHNRM